MCPSLHENKGVGGWPLKTGLSPPVKYCTDHSKAVLLFLDLLCFSVLCLLCLCVR